MEYLTQPARVGSPTQDHAVLIRLLVELSDRSAGGQAQEHPHSERDLLHTQRTPLRRIRTVHFQGVSIAKTIIATGGC